MGRVPLARRNLLAEPRRLVVGVVGIGLALMLIGLLGGLWAGIRAQSAQYVNASGAALWVLPPGTRTLFAEGTELPVGTLRGVRATPGVEWAAPAWGLFAILNLHDARAAVVLVGSTPGQRGGPGRWPGGAPPSPMTRSPSTGSSPASTASTWVTACPSPTAATGSWESPAMPGS
jgi:putative ABC transport system permease protein